MAGRIISGSKTHNKPESSITNKINIYVQPCTETRRFFVSNKFNANYLVNHDGNIKHTTLLRSN